MSYGTTYNQGSIVLVQFPYTDFSSPKKRPALVISPDWFNLSYKDIILSAITSSIPENIDKQKEIVTEISLDDLESGVIVERSIIKITKIFTCEQNIILKRVAELKKEKMSEVLEKLRNFFSE